MYRILVVEDKEMHQNAAREILKDHEVTIVSSFDEAMNLMVRKIDKGNVANLLTKAGFPTQSSSVDKDRWSAYWKAREKAEAESLIPFPFDVVLTDMMMPMSSRTLSPDAYRYGEQVPYGFVIALRATLCGAKFVAMVTDTNHHKGAMSAAIDHLGSAYYNNGFVPNFEINGARVMFIHAPFLTEILGKKPCGWCLGSGACKFCSGTGKRGNSQCNSCGENLGVCDNCKGAKEVDNIYQERKDWGQVLADLTQQANA